MREFSMAKGYNIAIDMRGIQTGSFFRGIGTLWREIMKQLAEIDRKNRYILLYAKNFPASDDGIEYPENFRKIFVDVPFFKNKYSIFYLWTVDYRHIERIFIGEGADVMMLTQFAEVRFPGKPSKKIPTAVWIYDLIPFRFQEEYFKKAKFGSIKKFLMTKKLKYTAQASMIIAISNAVKSELEKIDEFSKKNIAVVPLGVRKNFFEISDDDIKALADKFGLPEKFLLYIGGIDPRKNLLRLLDAYSIARNRIDLPPIVIAGKLDPTHKDYYRLMDKIKNLSLSENIIFSGFIPDELLPALYRAAMFLVFPSLYEGFGLPVVEAMAAECPVLTSNISAMPEVADDCAVFVDPYDASSIADGIVALASSEELRKRLVACGRRRAQHFSWKNSAEKFIKVMERVAENGI
ncbi:glycosyltransferase family 4 protein [bacterium]|nr:glycosyltransferase family 4 protein [bacterium]